MKQFFVGDSEPGGRLLSARAIVPILDGSGGALGFTGRSLFEQCDKCKGYHDQEGFCPHSDSLGRYAKWVNSEGFRADSVLYNWLALRAKIKPRIVILVEGAADVWRLHEAGFPNGVALLKADLSDAQQILLETGGVCGVVIATDSDPAGEAAAQRIESKLGRNFWVERWIPQAKDVGDSPIELLQDGITPLLERMEKKL